VVCLTAFAPWIGLLFAGMVLAGFFSIWFIALANALVQLRSEPEMRGRVMGAWTMALPGMLPITSLLVGAVATWGGGAAGAREAFALGGAALIVTAAVGWRSLADGGVHDRAPADLTADAYIEDMATAGAKSAA
jgi:MFS family permease